MRCMLTSLEELRNYLTELNAFRSLESEDKITGQSLWHVPLSAQVSFIRTRWLNKPRPAGASQRRTGWKANSPYRGYW